MLEPSEVLTDLMGNAYYFRLTDAAPNAAPESLELVADDVRRNLRRQAAYERVLETARRIAETARTTSLSQAGADWPQHTTRPFTPGLGLSEPGAFGLGDASPAARLAGSQEVARGVYRMLARSASEELALEEAVELIEIAPAFTAVVARPTELSGKTSP